MSDLREAIYALPRYNCTDDTGEHGHWVNVHEVAALAEAYLREHADAETLPTTRLGWLALIHEVGWKATDLERERIRQRIKVLPCSSPVPAYKSGYEDAQTDALEAIKEDT